MRHTLRDMIDNGEIHAAVPMAPIAKPQPDPTIRQQAMDPKPGTNKLKDTSKQQGASMAKTVSENLQDPLGTTQEGFDELNEKQMEYELAKQKMARNLAPVKSVIQHVEQMHDMNQNGIPDELEPGMADQAMGYHGPNVSDRSRLGMGPMAQQPGRMQMNKPGQMVSYPGAGPKIPGAPARQANPEAPPQKAAPKGQQSSSKAMKPGKQSPRNIKVSVKASDGIARGVSERIRSTYAAAQLANMSCCDMTKPAVKAGGPGSGRHPGYGQFGNPQVGREPNRQTSRTYRAPGGHQVVVNSRPDDSHEVREYRGGSWVTTHSGDRGSTVNHLSQRYGIVWGTSH